jgi:excisionase family DNA binding protein
MMKDTELIVVAKAKDLRQIVREEILAAQKPDRIKEFQERMTRSEAAVFLGIRYQTVYHWLKKGRIKEHGLGRKKYFLKLELILAQENKSNNKESI